MERPPADVEFGSHALLRRHTRTFQDPHLVPASVQLHRDNVRALKAKLEPSFRTEFPNQLVLNRAAIDREVCFTGGIASLLDAEYIIMEFLPPDDLLSASLVCRLWNVLSRQDSLWKKFLTSPAEGYPLRQLLGLEDELRIPAIQVYMLFRSCGVLKSSWIDVCKSVHLGSPALTHGLQPLSQWLSTQSTPLHPPLLQAMCRQFLMACIAAESIGVNFESISFDSIHVHRTSTAQAPLLQIVNMPHDREFFRRRNEDELLYRRRTNGSAIGMAFLYGAMDLCAGRELMHESLIRRCLNDREHMSMGMFELSKCTSDVPVAFKSMVEFGIYVVVAGLPLSTILEHAYFDDTTTAAWPVHLHLDIDSSMAYLSKIVGWYTDHPRHPRATPSRKNVQVPSTSLAATACLAGDVDRVALRSYRYTSLRAPPEADTLWMELLAQEQKHTLQVLDLSQATPLPTTTILRTLESLDMLTDLILPRTVFHNNIELLVQAFPPNLSRLKRIDKAFLTALDSLDTSYERQLNIVSFAYGSHVQSA
ncbi:unnamed protein product [Aphanomyces euteiches]|nr:hypothetical protein AeRB84_012417 [Aphanomyces euteiches]